MVVTELWQIHNHSAMPIILGISGLCWCDTHLCHLFTILTRDELIIANQNSDMRNSINEVVLSRDKTVSIILIIVNSSIIMLDTLAANTAHKSDS